jgi:hypothetical protein
MGAQSYGRYKLPCAAGGPANQNSHQVNKDVRYRFVIDMKSLSA